MFALGSYYYPEQGFFPVGERSEKNVGNRNPITILLNLPGEHWNRKKVYTILNGWIVQLPWQENMD